MESLDKNIDYLDLMSQLYHLATQINARIEPHLFIRDEDQSGFAEMVEKTGQKLLAYFLVFPLVFFYGRKTYDQRVAYHGRTDTQSFSQ